MACKLQVYRKSGMSKFTPSSRRFWKLLALRSLLQCLMRSIRNTMPSQAQRKEIKKQDEQTQPADRGHFEQRERPRMHVDTVDVLDSKDKCQKA